jgi:tetratricopeptide (TPR) repeat protein
MTIWLGFIALGLGLGASLFMPVPQNLKTSFDAGQSLYALGEFEGAILEYDKIVNFKSKAVRTDSVRVKFGDELELPVMAAAWYQLGNSRKKNGQHEQAVAAYRNVMDTEGVPNDFRSLVQYQVAETYFLQQNFEGASAEYKRYVEIFPKSDVAGKAYFYAGWSEFNAKQYDQCIQTLNAMLQSYATDKYACDAMFRIASAYFEKGDYQTAADMSQQVLDKYPDNPIIAQAEYLKANAYDQLGRSEEAIAAYRNVRGLYDRMFELLRGSFREGKNLDFESYRELFETSSLRVAEIYRKNNQFDEAYKELIAVQEIAEERFYKAKVQMRIGDNYMEWKRFDDAWSAYDQVINLYADTPYPPNAQYNKGEARYYADKYAEARQDYLDLVAKYPDTDTELRAAALYNAGWCSEKLEETDKALEYYGQVVENFSRSERAPACNLRMATLTYRQGKVQEAIAIYQRIIEESQNPKTDSDAYYGLGVLYQEEGQADKAIESFMKVSKDARDTYVASLTAAVNLHAKNGNNQEARRLLETVVQEVAGDHELEAQAYYQIAQLDLNNEKYAEAQAGYTRVIEQYSDTPQGRDSHYGRGVALHHLGQPEKALADFQQMLAAKTAPPVLNRTKYSMALSYSALGRDAETTQLLNEVISWGGDENLVRSSRLKLISMAEKKDPAEAVRTYESMLPGMTSPDDQQWIWGRLAGAYFKLGQFDKSLDASQRLLAMPNASEESTVNALFVQGNSYFKLGDATNAIASYRKVLDQFPKAPLAKNCLFQLGVAYNTLSVQRLDALPQVVTAFRDYHTKYPDDENAVHAHYFAGWGLYRIGNWKEVIKEFTELADQYPTSGYAPEVLYRTGEAIFNQRVTVEERDSNFNSAATYFDRVINNYPNSDYVDDSMYSKAWCMINLKREQEAMTIFNSIVAKYPKDRYGARSQFTVGDYYYGLKDYDNATASYQKFLELYPEEALTTQQDKQLRRKASALLEQLSEINAYNLYVQGQQLFDEKKYDDAIKIFEDVMQKFPDSDQAVNAAVEIGAAYQNREKFKEAGKIYQQIVEKYESKPKYSTQVDFAKAQLVAMQKAQVI